MTTHRNIVLFCLLVAFCCLAATAAATEQQPPEPSPAAMARQLADHLGSLDSLSFTFTQLTSGQLSGRPRQASGTAHLARLGDTAMMRWNYHSPDKQVILSDGEMLKMYFASLNQLIITPADSLQRDVTYSLFTGSESVLDDFTVESAAGEQTASDGEAFRAITLRPVAPASQIREITLWILDGTRIKRIEIVDAFDTITQLNITNIEENSLTTPDGSLENPDFFQFTPPEGTEIIRQ